MTDLQFLAVTIGPVVSVGVVLIGLLFNSRVINSRFEDLNNRMNDLHRMVDNRLGDLRDGMRAEMAKNHSELLHKFTELDNRLTRLETELGERG